MSCILYIINRCDFVAQQVEQWTRFLKIQSLNLAYLQRIRTQYSTGRAVDYISEVAVLKFRALQWTRTRPPISANLKGQQVEEEK